jgi:hypothetical protein
MKRSPTALPGLLGLFLLLIVTVIAWPVGSESAAAAGQTGGRKAGGVGPRLGPYTQQQQQEPRRENESRAAAGGDADDREGAGDPDLGPGGLDRETYIRLRNEYIAMLRGYVPDRPFDPNARGRAIKETELKERALAEAPAASGGIAPAINTSTWTPIGPAPVPNGQTFTRIDPVSGRTIAIAVHPTNPNTVYAGTAAGGVYRSLDGGASWTPIFDGAQSLSVDAIAIAPSQPSTVYVGTGEIIGFFGVGVYRIDNADSANPTLVGPINPVTDQGNGSNFPAFQQTVVSEILVHPTDPATIFVSTANGLGGIVSHNFSLPNARASFGVYRSTNATSALNSIAFTKLTVNTSGGLSKGDTLVTDMVMEPGNPNAVVCWVEGAATAGGGGVYRSANALAAAPTFTQTLITNSDFARGELAINKSGAVTTVLAATEETPSGVCPANQVGRLRKSSDGGQTWPTSLSGGDGFCGGQCGYDIAVEMNQTAASPIMHLGGSADYNPASDCSVINKRSTNGGGTFTKNETGLHPDVHVVAVAPSNQNIVYTGNDGGIWKSTDGGANWTSLNNSTYTATQFISMALHPTDREYMTGGTQDNGTEFRRANGTWTQIAQGDGGYTLIDRNAVDTTNVTVYHTYYNLTNAQILFERVTTTADAEAMNWTTRGAFPNINGVCASNNGISCTDNVLFYAPMALGPGNPNTLYFGTDRLYRSTNRGDNMTVVGSAGAISGTSPIATISVSPQNDNVRVVGLRNGQVWATTTGGSFVNVTPTNAPAAPVGKVFIDPTNSNTAYVTYGGFGVTTGRHIFKTTNLNGAPPTWADSGGGIPDVPVDAFTVDRLSPQNLYAGTDIGVYRSTNGGTSWTPFNGGLPRIPIFDIGFQEQGQTDPNSARVLRIATHGRGIWEIQVGGGGGGTGDCPAQITQSSSQAITAGNSVSCNSNSPNFYHSDNSYWRAFNLASFGVTAQYNVTSVDFGVEAADAAGTGTTQPVTVRLYANSGGAFPSGTRTQIATTTAQVSDQSGTVLNAPLTAAVPAGTTELVMEVFTPDGQAAGNKFFIGTNTSAETGPSYISAPSCDINTPTTMTDLGFPNVHFVMNVNGSCPTSTDCPLTEGFDNVTTLSSAGWAATNNSSPLGTTGWFQGNNTFPSQSGAANSYIAADFNNTTNSNTISDWLMSPAVSLQNGTQLTFYTRTVDDPQFPDRLQVRMSLNGASTNVGSTSTSVGDFTTLLLDINPTYTTTDYPSAWTQFTVTLSGISTPTTGRLAFRYFVESGGPAGDNSDYIGIDSVQICGTAASGGMRIDTVSPRVGRASGGRQVTLTGAFTGLSTVSIGGASVPWSSAGAGSITFNTPAHAAGAVSIVLTPTSGSAVTKANAFAYLPTAFTDNTLTAGVTQVKVQHITELRQAVDSMRAVAGLSGAPWTDPTLVQFVTPVKAAHIAELRTYLEDAASRLGLAAGSYTDPTLGTGFVIKRVHIEELRQRIRDIAG